MYVYALGASNVSSCTHVGREGGEEVTSQENESRESRYWFFIKNATTPLNESQQVAGSRGPVSRAGGRDGGEEVTSQENESRESRYWFSYLKCHDSFKQVATSRGESRAGGPGRRGGQGRDSLRLV